MRQIGLTRPAGRNEQLAAALLATGFMPRAFPLWQIQPGEQPCPADAATNGFIFVSPSAVDIGWPALQRAGLPLAQQTLAAVGAATAASLITCRPGEVLYPADRGDASHLLALPRLQQVAGERWCLIQGDHARPELAATLTGRGAEVVPWCAYQQRWDAMQAQALLQALAELDALLLTSSGQIDQLFAMAGESQRLQLQSLPIVVWHPRNAALCHRFGIRHVIEADGEAATPDCLVHFFACPHHD